MSLKFKPLTREEVVFSWEMEPDDTEIDFQSGDPDYKDADDQLERDARKRLCEGDYWAWAVVTVKAQWGSFSASTAIGGCSFRDEDDFLQDGQLSELEDRALAKLNDTMESIFHTMMKRAV